MLTKTMLCVFLMFAALGYAMSASVLVSNDELKSLVMKLQKEVKDLRENVNKPMGACEASKCGKCKCVEDLSISEKHYCDCRRLLPRRDCKAFYLAGFYAPGIYTVTMHGLKKVDVFCDGSGWTVIQRRIDGSTNFYRSWQQYKHGFGKLQGEFWMGNENLYALSTQALMPRGSEMKIEMKSPHSWDLTYLAFYKHFSIDSEAANYKLHIKYSFGNGDSLTSMTTWNSQLLIGTTTKVTIRIVHVTFMVRGGTTHVQNRILMDFTIHARAENRKRK